MFWPFKKRATWPPHLPRLYPRLDSQALSSFLTEAEHARIHGLTRVRVMPLFSEAGTQGEVFFGMGLSRLLLRDLMLVRGLSVRGPEDTPTASYEEVNADPSHLMEEALVTGRVKLGGRRFRVDLELWSSQGEGAVRTVESESFEEFLRCVSTGVAQTLGGAVSPEALKAWHLGRPSTAASLIRFGELSLARPCQPEDVLALRALDPGFVLPVYLLEDEAPERLQHLLSALEADPYDPQLHFMLFCSTWNGAGEQPEAMQFIRRALELSPGHGKAHMCAPHAASPKADMLRHAELGYSLLPGNSFAISNYINALLRSGTAGSVERVLELSREIIALDPQSPDGYLQAVHILRRAGRPREALCFAQELQELYGPPMDPRTRYCLEQNPQVRDRLRAGTLDPVRELAELIAQLRQESDKAK
jgi:TolB-like protein